MASQATAKHRRGHYYYSRMNVVSTLNLPGDISACQRCGKIIYRSAVAVDVPIQVPADLYKKLVQNNVTAVRFDAICPLLQRDSSHHCMPSNQLDFRPLEIPEIQHPGYYLYQSEEKMFHEFTEKFFLSMKADWKRALREEFSKPYFKELCRRLFEDIKVKKIDVYPPLELVFSWTKTPIKDVKVVIMGQDPYFKPGQANGLCFSVSNGISVPPSLLAIYKELESDIPTFKRPVYVDNVHVYDIRGDIAHGNLIGWARQGVLLLNSILTVKGGSPKSHKNYGWVQFTDAVIRYLNEYNSDAVFMLWGVPAQQKCENISGHHILWAPHPARNWEGFPGCKHFSRCNLLLQLQGLPPIDWGYLPMRDD